MNSRNQHIEIHQLLKHLHSRDLSPEEWTSLEAYSVGDPFLLDALEGLRSVSVDQRMEHLQSIQKALAAKYTDRKQVRRMTLWMRAVASVLLLIGMLWIVKYDILNNRNGIIAEVISPTDEAVVANDDMGYSDSMLMTEAVPETPAGSIGGPRIQSSSGESSKDRERSTRMNEGSTANAERIAATDEKGDSHVADRARPEITDRSEPASRATYPSETLSKDAEDSGTSFLLPEVKGIVMNRSGEPVSGAQVSFKGTNTETETDYLGNFALDIPNQNYRNALVISHDAYPVIEAEVADGDSLVVRLQEPASNEKADVTTLTQLRAAKKVSPGSRSMATPISGERSYQKYIRQNLRYPTTAANSGIHGIVVVEFDVSADGSPHNFKIVQSLGYGCDEEAIRLIREGPKWNGGQVKIGRWEVAF